MDSYKYLYRCGMTHLSDVLSSRASQTFYIRLCEIVELHPVWRLSATIPSQVRDSANDTLAWRQLLLGREKNVYTHDAHMSMKISVNGFKNTIACTNMHIYNELKGRRMSISDSSEPLKQQSSSWI